VGGWVRHKAQEQTDAGTLQADGFQRMAVAEIGGSSGVILCRRQAEPIVEQQRK